MKQTYARPPQALERKGRFLRESMTPHRTQIDERRRKALELRAGGMSCEQVGLRLAADPAVNSSHTAFPAGYGFYNYVRGKPPLSARALARAVSLDLREVIERNAELEAESFLNYRAIVVKRLEMLTMALWPEAMKGNHWSSFRVIQITERLSKMHGWDSEKRMIESEATLTVRGAASASPQPDWKDPIYLRKFLDALAEGELSSQSAVENALTLVPDVDVIDAEVVD